MGHQAESSTISRVCDVLRAGLFMAGATVAPAAAQSTGGAAGTDSRTSLIVAVIAGAASIIGVVLGLLGSAAQRKSDKEIAQLKGRLDDANLHTKYELQRQEKETDARNADLAKKRLLIESVRREARGADQRIKWIATQSRSGTLDGLLANNRPEWKRTIYALVAPVALADRVGDVNAGDDRLVARQYALVRCLRTLLSADEELARAAGLQYQPGKLTAAKVPKTKENFRIYDVQGVQLLNELLELFRGPNDDPPLARPEDFFARFSTSADFDNAIQTIGSILRDFDPREKPVFWTILIAYAYVAQALEDAAGQEDLRSWLARHELRRADYDPSDGGPGAPDLFEVPSGASRKWLGEKLA